MTQNRQQARTLAKTYIEKGKPLEWFEALYRLAKRENASIPWADMEPNPNLVAWLGKKKIRGAGRTALKVGCGLGDDVELLGNHGFDVIGFDISPTAVTWCKKRFPASAAKFVEGDLFRAPANWNRAFDFVFESYTLQVLPPELRLKAIRKISEFVSPGGRLLAIARGRDPLDDPGQMPWPLTKEELLQFDETGLTLLSFEDYYDDETPPVRRFRAEFRAGSPVRRSARFSSAGTR